jgi:hypothetical protein
MRSLLIQSFLPQRIIYKICLGLYGSFAQKTFADQAPIAAGDITFTRINLDVLDSFSFVALSANLFT